MQGGDKVIRRNIRSGSLAVEPTAGERSSTARFGRPRLRIRVRASAAVGMAGALVLGLGAGSAFGYFTAGGAGHGSASTATLLPALGAHGVPATWLVPGRTADVVVEVTNPNLFAVWVVSATAGGDVTVDAGHPTCTPASVGFTNPGSLNVLIPAGTTQALSFPAAASMSISAPNACQGASFSIPLTLTVRSS